MKALYRLALITFLTAVLLVWDYADSRDMAESAQKSSPAHPITVVFCPLDT